MTFYKSSRRLASSEKKVLVELHQAVKLNNLEKVEKLLKESDSSESDGGALASSAVKS